MLKALIINRNRPGRDLIDKKRFQKLIKTLKKGGIEARYHTLETKQSLLALLEQKQPDLVYCANYYVLDENNKAINAHALIDEFGVCRVGSAVDALELVEVVGAGGDTSGDLREGQVAVGDAEDAQGYDGEVALAGEAEALAQRLDKERDIAVS